MHSGELQRRAAGDADWLARLRGRAREGWGVEDHSWVCSGGPAVTGHGLRGAVVGWYLPVLVVDERADEEGRRHQCGGTDEEGCSGQNSWRGRAGSRDSVQTRVVQTQNEQGAAGGDYRTEGAADGGREVLVEGQEVWEEWTGQTVEDTEWRRQAKGQWRAKEQAVVRRGWDKNEVHDKDKVDRDKVYDRG